MDATFEQDPLVPRWVLGAAVACLALAVVLAGLWFTLVRPGIASAATEAAKVEASKAAAAAAETGAEDAAAAAAGAAAASPAPSGSAKPTKKPEPGAPGNPLTVSTTFRIQTNAAPSTSFSTFQFDAQPKKPLDVTDLQLQNPAADSGFIQVLRAGKVIYTAGLDNFRDLPQAYVTPIRYAKGQKVVVAIQCLNPAPEKKRCSAAVTINGMTS